MIDKTIGRDKQSIILKHITPEKRLRSLEEESRNILEIDPDHGIRYFITSFRRKKNRNDAQKDTETADG